MYDYVIVGAGAAGCVLANRLSEDPATRVLLLEAGPADKKMEIKIPAAFTKLFKTEVDWDYDTEEQPALNNRRLYIPRGKMLGGSSSMNAQMYVRGNPRDYDEWAELAGPGWSYADVLPIFKRIERYPSGDPATRGDAGPVRITFPRSTNPLSQAFLDACREAGIDLNADYNDGNQDGAGWTQVTQRDGQRHSAADAYLRPAMARPNLTVMSEARVQRVLFEGSRACGVEYLRHGEKQQVRAAGEVILSGGAINSPQLLMLSGVGPAAHLRDVGIQVVADLPGVGRNLQDHLMAVAAHVCTQPVSMMTVEKPINLLRYLIFKRGPLTSNIAEITGFVRTSNDLPRPDIQLMFAPLYYLNHGFTRPDGHGFSVGAVLLHPRSRGTISLRSADPQAAPVIQPNFLDHPDDLATLVKGLRLCRSIAADGQAFAQYRGEEYCPGREAVSDEALAVHVRATAEAVYHPVGTCKMGDDAIAVVDGELRVHGLDGLRVVDASIMPTITSGNTYAPTLLIAEKAAEMILSTSSSARVLPIREPASAVA